MTIEWLPDLATWTPVDWGAASGIGTLLVAVSATLIARRQLIQARELREEEAAPFIAVDVVPDRPGGWILDLVIENTGKTMARDVRIRFDPPIQSAVDMKGYEPQNWAPLKDGITTLIPGRRLHSLFDSTIERARTNLPRQYEVVVDCNDARGRPQPTVAITIDLEPVYGAMTSREQGLHQLVEEVERLRQAVEPITKKSLTVEVYDGAAQEVKRAERRAEQERFLAEAEARDQAGADPASAADTTAGTSSARPDGIGDEATER